MPRQGDLTTIISLVPVLLEVFNNCGNRRRRRQAIRDMRDPKVCCAKISAAIDLADSDDLPMRGAELGDLKDSLEAMAK